MSRGAEAVHLPELVQIAGRLVDSLESDGITFRLFGSCAIWWLCQHGRSILGKNTRKPKDIDGVVDARFVNKFLTELIRKGWVSDEGLRVWSEGRRLRLRHAETQIVLDVCVGDLQFAQTLHLGDRIRLLPVSLSPADILLSKLQIVEMTRNDVIDAAVLMCSFELGTDEVNTICIKRVIDITRRSWRWYKGVCFGLHQVISLVSEGAVELSTNESDTVYARSKLITEQILTARKTPGWRIRSLCGNLIQWYDEVDSPRAEMST